jgi:hypothetical protein
MDGVGVHLERRVLALHRLAHLLALRRQGLPELAATVEEQVVHGVEDKDALGRSRNAGVTGARRTSQRATGQAQATRIREDAVWETVAPSTELGGRT